MRWLAAIAALVPIVCNAQESSTMRFDVEEWDFGVIREADGAVEHTFRFTNAGREAFVVERVRTSCGCTTSEYTTGAVRPGERGSVTVRFDPEERPGAFEQEVRVVSRAGRNRNVLTIRGTVVPRPRSVEEDYPFVLDEGFRLSQLTLNFGQVEQGRSKAMSVGYVNDSPLPVMLEWSAEPEREFLMVDAPVVVGPGGRGEIVVTYDLRRTEFYGRYADRIYLKINGERQVLPLSATFTAVDAFAEGDRVPRAEITPLFHQHGDVGHGEKLVRELRIANVGRSPLVVRWINVRPGMSTTLRAGTVVQPGGSERFTVTMDTGAFQRGVQTGAIGILTNDPARPMRDVRSAANVK